MENARDMVEDPQLSYRDYYEELEHPAMGACLHPGWPARLSKTSYKLRPSPLLGEHNEFVLCELLGISDEEFVELVQEKVLE